jgi:ABC-type transport system involved in cytochrome c biogenesis permease subunit
MKFVALALVLVFAGTIGLARAQEPAPAPSAAQRTQPWDPELVKLVETMPVQEQGRVKPLWTFAHYKLLQFNGKSTLSFKDGRKSLNATEWLLDCLLFPDQARKYPCFLLQTWDLADALQLKYEREGEHAKGKRDRWSFDELLPGLNQLDDRVREIVRDPLKREAKNRTSIEEQLVQLREKVLDFESLLLLLEFARHDAPVKADSGAAASFGGATSVSFATLFAKLPELTKTLASLNTTEPTDLAKKNALQQLVRGYGDELSRYSTGLAFLPPAGPKEDAWLTVANAYAARSGAAPGDPSKTDGYVASITALEEAVHHADDPALVKAALTKVRGDVVQLATERGEYAKIESEVSFYKADLLYNALVLYVFGFVAVAIGWMLRADRVWHRVLPWAVMVPLALHVTAIVWRCWLRSRPPITNLYETIPFIGAAGVAVALAIEFINRRRIGVAVATFMGAATLFLANRFEAKEAFEHGSDTMPQLVAVLDTNFWLATHVTTINLGYAAGVLAGLIAHVYVVGRALGLKKNDPDFYRQVARMVYGVLCFGLLFSVVGTILGGVWANDSWGRFWGWDPKENGALMICLCELAILHARMGGYVQQLGLCNAAVAGNIVVIFSWWHVNQLGVGLHSYGKTEGMLFWIWLCYTVEFLVFLAGLYVWLDQRSQRRRGGALPSSGTA